MKCLGEVFDYLAAFLCRETAWKLACTDEYAALRLRTGTVERDGLAAVFLRIRLEHVSAMDCFRLFRDVSALDKFRSRWLDGPSFRFLMHELVGVLQKGLKLHERSPRPSLSYNRDRYRTSGAWVCKPESFLMPYEVTPLHQYVESTWHPSCRNVGILMVTRQQYVRLSRKHKPRIPDSDLHRGFQICSRKPESQIDYLPVYCLGVHEANRPRTADAYSVGNRCMRTDCECRVFA